VGGGVKLRWGGAAKQVAVAPEPAPQPVPQPAPAPVVQPVEPAPQPIRGLW
jgi:hypothetical protein